MIDIDTQAEPIKVPCYLLLCQPCQIEVKNNERDKKLNKVLKRGLKERIMNFINSVMEWLK
jgi:hypothetical protein